ncbi:hypothetical protein ElyMa_005625000 [Elysia marginata]|uniref:Uncharacterized protein n=1 Tax=Elysia marginata TaxID=1093978 RepID=A0AAV4F743_9GAST|nr:hypothetical protein ElyMa_005625000 [Elysia marginata]
MLQRYPTAISTCSRHWCRCCCCFFLVLVGGGDDFNGDDDNYDGDDDYDDDGMVKTTTMINGDDNIYLHAMSASPYDLQLCSTLTGAHQKVEEQN